MRFTIITPCFNRSDFLEETVQSVLSQKGAFEIEYIAQNGGSNPAVEEILRRWKNRIESVEFEACCSFLSFDYYSKGDFGMYDAINRGLQKSSGDILAWINSDDIYFPGAFDAVEKIFSQYPEIDWLIGKTALVNAAGAVTYTEGAPKSISRAFVRNGYYRADLPFFNWLPQDSIFWRRGLWEKAGPLEISSRLVSDFNLWQSFARFAEPVKVDCLLGAFRHHGNQLTGSPDAYKNELGPAPKLPFCLKLACGTAWLFPNVVRTPEKILGGNALVKLFGLRRKDTQGRMCSWDPQSSSWLISVRPAI